MTKSSKAPATQAEPATNGGTLGTLLRRVWEVYSRSYAEVAIAMRPAAERLAALRIDYKTKDGLRDVAGRTTGYRGAFMSALAEAYEIDTDDLAKHRKREDVQSFERTLRNHIARVLEEWAAKGSQHPKSADIRKALDAIAKQREDAQAERDKANGAEPETTDPAVTIPQQAIAMANWLRQNADNFSSGDVPALRKIREHADQVLGRLAKGEKSEQAGQSAA